jgi:hypothetical protein
VRHLTDREVFIMANGQNTSRETAIQHIFHTIEQATLSIMIAAVAGTIVGIVAAEAVAAVLTQSVPGWPTHIIALVAGLLLGYAAAATVTIWELVVGIAGTLRAIGGDLERAGERVVNELETLAGVQGQQTNGGGRSVTVEGSLVSRDQPAETAMWGDVAATPPVPSVPMTSARSPESPAARTSPRPQPVQSSAANGSGPERFSGLTAPLVPTQSEN